MHAHVHQKHTLGVAALEAAKRKLMGQTEGHSSTDSEEESEDGDPCKRQRKKGGDDDDDEEDDDESGFLNFLFPQQDRERMRTYLVSEFNGRNLGRTG